MVYGKNCLSVCRCMTRPFDVCNKRPASLTQCLCLCESLSWFYGLHVRQISCTTYHVWTVIVREEYLLAYRSKGLWVYEFTIKSDLFAIPSKHIPFFYFICTKRSIVKVSWMAFFFYISSPFCLLQSDRWTFIYFWPTDFFTAKVCIQNNRLCPLLLSWKA